MFLAAVVLTAVVYAPGLTGSWLFDDYPNIVDNHDLQIHRVDIASLTRAAMSSPSSEFKRPLASLSFAANYLASGLHPFWWKVTNVIIHLLNGLLVYLLAWRLLLAVPPNTRHSGAGIAGTRNLVEGEAGPEKIPGSALARSPGMTKGKQARRSAMAGRKTARSRGEVSEGARAGIIAALIAAGWMLLPINLTAVLYVVQRMESLANLFVLLGLLGYLTARTRMLAGERGLLLCWMSLIVPTAIGALFKETAVMLPLYAFLIEWLVFRFGRNTASGPAAEASEKPESPRYDARIIGLFAIILLLPLILGLAWQLPHVLNPEAWATRDFTLRTRLLSETRIVVGYIVWCLVPLPQHLSFYHDYFHISTGLLTPWTTLASIVVLAILVGAVFWYRKYRPLVALGIALFLGCHLLTGTILPLELVYEHRNYFASFGLLLAIVPLLAAPADRHAASRLSLALPRYTVLTALFVWWIALTAFTAYAWRNQVSLAQELAIRAPTSPRAQYELGRTYLIYSHYDPDSPYTKLVYAPLERAAALPDSSILPQQALIFMNAHMHRPIKDVWWDSMIAKLKARPPGVQDESSLGALTKCTIKGGCDLPHARMVAAFEAALSHPHPAARLQASYADYAWNVLGDHALGERMARNAVRAKPSEPVYHITLARMCLVLNDLDCTRAQIKALQRLNLGGSLDPDIASLRGLLATRE